MSSVGQAHRGGFIVALLRTGAPVIAEVPNELPDQAVDPAPLPGWRRISMMAGSSGDGVPDSLLVRACRYVVLVPLSYRAVAIPVLLLSVIATNGGVGVPQAVVLAAFGVLVNLAAIVWVLRVHGFRSSVAKVLLTADVVVAFAANLVASLAVPDPGWDEVGEMTWVYLVGAVALLTLARGVPAGVALIVACVPFHILITAAGGHLNAPVASAVNDIVTLLPALVVAIAVLLLVGLGTRLAMGVGLRRGREAELARSRRAVHDTVLQTLEAMALRPPNPPDNLRAAVAQLDELRGIARAQALELRRSLIERRVDGYAAAAGLGEELAAVATEMAREGLSARLVFTEMDDGSLPEARRTAVRDAVREAMRNTMKHAGTTEVVLRVEQRDGGVAVIARDHGIGFSVADRPAGFGISDSITARLTEVGGTSTVESEPGRGTRVTLWVPL